MLAVLLHNGGRLPAGAGLRAEASGQQRAETPGQQPASRPRSATVVYASPVGRDRGLTAAQ